MKTLEMPEVAGCEATECAYNRDPLGLTRAGAIVIDKKLLAECLERPRQECDMVTQ